MPFIFIKFTLFTKQKKYISPDDLRGKLKKPLGQLVKSIKQTEKYIDKNSLVIEVGDIAAINLFKNNSQADISVFDWRTNREEID